MAKGYCWRCQKFVALIPESDMEVFGKLYTEAVKKAKEYREINQASFNDTPFRELFAEVYDFYAKLGGDTDIQQGHLMKHALIGPECPSCGKNFRTLSSAYCAECGYRPASERT